MSDYISGLRADLLEAAARERHRGALGRTTRRLHPRAWAPGAAPAAIAIAAAAAFVVAVIALAPGRAQRAAVPKVVTTIDVGGLPVSASFGRGSLWIADFDGTLVRVDPRHGRVIRRYALGVQLNALTAARDGLWVRAVGTGFSGRVLHVDPSTGRILTRTGVGDGEGIAVGGSSVWVPHRFDNAEGIDRVARRGGAVLAPVGVQHVAGIAAAGGAVWAGVQEGTIVQIDAADGHVVRRWRALAPSGGNLDGTLAADARGLWVLSTARARIFRIERGRVVRRIAVDRTAQALIARTSDAIWIAAGGGRSVIDPTHSRVERIDQRTGRVTARVDLGSQRPAALVGDGRDLLVVTGAGRVLVVRG